MSAAPQTPDFRELLSRCAERGEDHVVLIPFWDERTSALCFAAFMASEGPAAAQGFYLNGKLVLPDPNVGRSPKL
jgi:hypothetical protein